MAYHSKHIADLVCSMEHWVRQLAIHTYCAFINDVLAVILSSVFVAQLSTDGIVVKRNLGNL